MRLLLVTPDYLSHYLPLAEIGREWLRRGGSVTVATGENLRRQVASDGFEQVPLQLGARGISDYVRRDGLGPAERAALDADVRATSGGMVAAFRHQATGRLEALLWQVDEILLQMREILRIYRPTHIISVQLAYSAIAALRALGVEFATLVTGHPSQIPVADEVYGVPHFRPSRFGRVGDEFDELFSLCRSIQSQFTSKFNEFVCRHNPSARQVANAFSTGSPWVVFHNYPGCLYERRRFVAAESEVLVGPIARRNGSDPDFAHWLEHSDRTQPLVVVALGSFFSLRTDVLRRLTTVLARGGFRVAMAIGENDIRNWGLPSQWFIRPFLPQHVIVRHADLVVFHGGNNTFLEAISSGIPMLVGPFCSDQFGIAADVERFDLGCVFDPNSSDSEEILRLASAALRARQRTTDLATRLRADGAELVCDRMVATFGQGAVESTDA